MTTSAFVDSCIETAAGSATAVARSVRGKPRARQLLRVLEGKKNILLTTHTHPDPDALASCLGLYILLKAKMPEAKIGVSIKGAIGGGLNSIFVQEMSMKLVGWDEAALGSCDAIVLLDTQPSFANSPLPASILPLAVIDHHRSSRGRRPKCRFCDIRNDVGASASIIFGYFMELEVPIPRDLGAVLLYAVESDLAGAAGQPNDLDNVALSNLTLIADPRKLRKMRYVDLPQSYFITYAAGLGNAVYYDDAILSHLDEIDSHEKPAIMADFLLRFDKVQWALVTAIAGNTMVLSLRTDDSKLSAADVMRRLVRQLGQGGGHRTKAGGGIPLESKAPKEIEKLRGRVRRRYLNALRITGSRGQRLVPKSSGGGEK